MDRDGVINADSIEYIRDPRDWQPLPGALDAIARLTRSGWRIYVATNQSGIGRGYFSSADLEAIHRKMLAAVHAAGGEIVAIHHCPHAPNDGCGCRKPRPGLLLQIGANEGIELGDVPFIGDKPSDAEAALAAGARPVLVGADTATYASANEIEHFTDLNDAVGALLRREPGSSSR